MSNSSKKERSVPSANETSTSRRSKRRLAAREQATSGQQSVTNSATPKASKRRKKSRVKRRTREPMASRALLSTDCIHRSNSSRNSDDAIRAVLVMPDGSSPVLLSRAKRSSHQSENTRESNAMPSSYGEGIGSPRIDHSLLQSAFNAAAAGAFTQPTSSRQEVPDQVASELHSASSSGTRKKASTRRKKKAKRSPREEVAPRASLPPDLSFAGPHSRVSIETLPALIEPDDGSSPSTSGRITRTVPHPEDEQRTDLGQADREARSPLHRSIETLPALIEPDDGSSPSTSGRITRTVPHLEDEQRVNLRQIDMESRSLLHRSIETLPALIEPDDGSSPSTSGRTTGIVHHPEDEQGTNLGQIDIEARSPLYPSSQCNMYDGTNRHERNPRFFSGEPTPSNSYATPSASIMEYAARATSRDTSNQAQGTPTDLSAVGEWRVVHEAGYCPVMSLSYVPPMKKDVGVFPSRSAAVRHGQQLVGSIGGYAWSQVRDSGDLEIVAATSSRWEICWRPPDSEYSRVTATLLAPGAGRWVVDVERGCIPDGAHCYVAPTKNTLGPFQSREIAVARAKKEVGGKRGLSWFEVLRAGDFENREDSANRWEGYWEPPDSEYSHVIVKLLVPAASADSGNGTSVSVGKSWNDELQPSSSRADLKRTPLMSSGAELPLAF